MIRLKDLVNVLDKESGFDIIPPKDSKDYMFSSCQDDLVEKYADYEVVKMYANVDDGCMVRIKKAGL